MVATASGRINAGQAYVIFGRAELPRGFNVASLNGSNGFTVNGSAATIAWAASAVDVAGDVNGDGVDDVLIGASGSIVPRGVGITARSGGVSSSSARRRRSRPRLDVSTLNGSNGFAMRGVTAGDGLRHAQRGR